MAKYGLSGDVIHAASSSRRESPSFASMFGIERERGRADGAGANVFDLALLRIGDDFVQRLASFDGRAADHRIAAGRIFGPIDLGEVRGQVIILVLRPALEGMVVALVAVEARGEEQVRGVLHQRFGRAERF